MAITADIPTIEPVDQAKMNEPSREVGQLGLTGSPIVNGEYVLPGSKADCITVNVLDNTNNVLGKFSTCSPLIEGNNPTGLETQPSSGLMKRQEFTLASDNGGSTFKFNFESPSVGKKVDEKTLGDNDGLTNFDFNQLANMND